MKKKILGLVMGAVLFSMASFFSTIDSYAANKYELIEMGEYGRPFLVEVEDSKEQIEEEIREGEMELISQLVEAEAGNQSLEGKIKVAAVVLNRVDDPRFPNTVEEVIFQDGQFSCIKDGGFNKAAWHMQDSDYEAVAYEVEHRSDTQALYFCAGGYIRNTTPLYKVGDHYFSK